MVRIKGNSLFILCDHLYRNRLFIQKPRQRSMAVSI